MKASLDILPLIAVVLAVILPAVCLLFASTIATTYLQRSRFDRKYKEFFLFRPMSIFLSGTGNAAVFLGAIMIIGYFLGSVGFFGLSAAVGVFIAVCFGLPTLIFLIPRSKVIRNFFKTDSSKDLRHRPKGPITFLCSDESDKNHRATEKVYIFSTFYIGLVLFIESSFALYIFSEFFTDKIPFSAIFYGYFFIIIFLYIYVGGYRSVITTDLLQISTISFISFSTFLYVLFNKGHFEKNIFDKLTLESPLYDAAAQYEYVLPSPWFEISSSIAIMINTIVFVTAAPGFWYRNSISIFGPNYETITVETVGNNQIDTPRLSGDLFTISDRDTRKRGLYVALTTVFWLILISGFALWAALIPALNGAVDANSISGPHFWYIQSLNILQFFINEPGFDIFGQLFLLAAVPMAIMSTCDSLMMSLAQLRYDFVRNIREISNEQVKKYKEHIYKVGFLCVITPVILFSLFDEQAFLSSMIISGHCAISISYSIFWCYLMKVIYRDFSIYSNDCFYLYFLFPFVLSFIIPFLVIFGDFSPPNSAISKTQSFLLNLGEYTLAINILYAMIFLIGYHSRAYINRRSDIRTTRV